MRERRHWDAATLLTINAGAFIVLGALAPWISVDTPAVTLYAWDMTAGDALWLVALVLAGTLIFALGYGENRRTPAITFMGGVLAAVAATAANANGIRALEAKGIPHDTAHPGIGVYVLYVAAVIALAGAIAGVRRIRAGRR
jgi:hypothetical protein